MNMINLKERKQWWAITKSDTVELVMAVPDVDPLYWRILKLQFVGKEGETLFATKKEAKEKLIAKLEERISRDTINLTKLKESLA